MCVLRPYLSNWLRNSVDARSLFSATQAWSSLNLLSLSSASLRVCTFPTLHSDSCDIFREYFNSFIIEKEFSQFKRGLRRETLTSKIQSGKISARNTAAISAVIPFICLNMGCFSMGSRRRDLPSPHPFPRCRSIHCIKLVLELRIRPQPRIPWAPPSHLTNKPPQIQIIAVINPYLVGIAKGDAQLGAKVIFLWGSLCCLSLTFAYFCVPEINGLSLEQIDRMLEETTPRKSSK